MDYEVLKAELTAGHPVTGAYNADAGVAAGEINALNIPRMRESMPGSEMFVNTHAAEFATLTDAKKSEWLAFCGIDTHAPLTNGSPAADFVTYIFGGGSTTISNLAAARNETVSQATVLGLPILEDWQIVKGRSI